LNGFGSRPAIRSNTTLAAWAPLRIATGASIASGWPLYGISAISPTASTSGWWWTWSVVVTGMRDCEPSSTPTVDHWLGSYAGCPDHGSGVNFSAVVESNHSSARCGRAVVQSQLTGLHALDARADDHAPLGQRLGGRVLEPLVERGERQIRALDQADQHLVEIESREVAVEDPVDELGE
jgi:hypothetical protein